MKLDYIDHSKSKTEVSATTSLNNCRVSVLGKGLFRAEYSAGEFLNDPTLRVWNRESSYSDYSVKKDDRFVIITMTDKSVFFDTLDFSNSYVIFSGSKKRINLNNDKNLKGATRTLDMSPEDMIHYDDPVTGKRVDIHYTDGRVLDDGVVSKNGVAVYDDVHSPVVKSVGTLVQNRLEHDYYVFIHKNDYFGALDDLYRLTGEVPMLPRYVFGNWWSRYWPYTDFEYLDLLDKFKEKGVPLSVATIDMDWHYVDIQKEFGIKEKGLDDEALYGEGHGWTGWSWNRHLFPDHKSFLKDIRDRKLKITLNIHPSSGIRWFEDHYEKACKVLGKDPKDKHVIPFDFTDNRFIETYFSMIKDLEDEGVDFWWIDWQQGTDSKIKGFDPLWALNHYHYYKKQEENKRGLILSRYAGPGSHRYPLGFSGDTTQKWHILDYVVRFTVKSTNSGYTFWSHDIAGHHSGRKDNELYIRWLQFAVFNPINRLHSTSGALYGKEPWNFDREIELLAIDLLRRRQSFIPYLYTVACDNHFNNKPFITPVYYFYPEDKRAYREDEYFLGDMLVCPITSRTEGKSRFAKRKVFLPEGDWTDVYTNTKYKGDRELTVCRKLAETPVFAKDGTIIYRDHDITGALDKPKAFDFKVFIGNGGATIYEDDGISLDYKNGKYFKTYISQELSSEFLTIKICYEGDASLVPSNRDYYFELPNVKVESVDNSAGFEQRFGFAENSSRIVMKGVKVGADFDIKVKYTDIDIKEYVLQQIKSVLLPFNGHNQDDHDLYYKMCGCEVEQLVEVIKKSFLPCGVKSRLLEIIQNV